MGSGWHARTAVATPVCGGWRRHKPIRAPVVAAGVAPAGHTNNINESTREDIVALIEKKLVTDRETASYKLDKRTIELLRCYSEFIGSPQEHVVNEALLFIFRKDKDFREWLTAHDKQVDLSKNEPDGKAAQGRNPSNGNEAWGVD